MGDPAREEPVLDRLVHRHRRIGEPDRHPLLEQEQPVGDRVRGADEASPEEVGHRLVEVEEHGHPGHAQGQGGEHEEVGNRVHLHEPEPLAPVRPGRRPATPDQEREVLAEVRPDAGPLVTLDVDPPHVDAFEDAGRLVARAAQSDDVDRPTRRDEGLGLAADPRVLVVVGVRDHEDRPLSTGRAGRSCAALRAPAASA